MNDYYGQSNLDIAYYRRALFSAIKKSALNIVIAAIVVGILGYFYTRSLTPEYRATAVMHIAPKDTAVFDLREIMFQRRDPAFQKTQIGILLSRNLIEQVVEEQKLYENPVFMVEKKSVLTFIKQKALSVIKPSDHAPKDMTRLITETVRDATRVTPRESSYLIEIEVTLPSAELSAQVANGIADAYIRSVYKSEREAAERSESWLLERLESVRNDLQDAERALQTFKEQENIIGNSEQSSGIAAQELDSIKKRLADAREQRVELEGIYQQLLSINNAGGDLQRIAAIKADAEVNNFQTRLLDLRQRQSELSKRYGPEHRKMIALVSEIQSVSSALNQQLGRSVSAIKSDFELAKANETRLIELLKNSSGKAQSIGRKQFDLLDLEQNVQTQREIYRAFLERLNKNRASDGRLNNNVRITDPALAPLRSIASKANKLVVMLMLIVVFIGLTIALLKELFDNSVMTANDVEGKLGNKAISLVPLITDISATEDAPHIAHRYYLDYKFSDYAEAVRSLRSNLLLSSLNSKKQRYLFTSTLPSEGKTSLAISTATAFGQVRKTLLIDADLRRPSVQHILPDYRNRRFLGLSDLTLGTASIEDCIHSLEEFSIDVLPAGTISPNPQELFCSTQFNNLLNSLSDIYDVIIFDTPPSGGLSDAHLLASFVDQLIYVVKAHETPVPKIRASIKRLEEINAPLRGVVLNQLDSKIEPLSYQYYGYGTGYGGYGGYEDDGKQSDSTTNLNDTDSLDDAKHSKQTTKSNDVTTNT